MYEEALTLGRVLKEGQDSKRAGGSVFMGSAMHAENVDFISPAMPRQSLLKAGFPRQTTA